MVGFVACLIWQWWSVKTTWQNARVQTLGAIHLEHELRKPLATMISSLDGILSDSQRELTDIKLRKLEMMKARLLKMSDVTDTMLITLGKDHIFQCPCIMLAEPRDRFVIRRQLFQQPYNLKISLRFNFQAS